MPSTLILLDFVSAAIGLYLLKKYFEKPAPPAPYPPGPKGLPLLGNALDFPSTREWETFAKWGKEYGDIMSVDVMGQRMVILNSPHIAAEMLEEKGAIYSNRPTLPMGGELVGWKNTLVLTPQGERHRQYRRLFHKLIGTGVSMQQFLPAEEEETHKFLRRVLAKPGDLQAHVRHTAGAIILKISHGYTVREQNDPFVELADRAVEQFSLSTSPGAWLVDMVPSMAQLPDWLPGTGFKKIAKSWNTTLQEMADSPHNFVKQQMAAGTAVPSFTSALLEEKEPDADEEHNIKWSAASLYSGGADTTVSAIYSFFVAMALFPEALKKAQAEIDAVVGNDRLPSFADRDQLPYTNALAKEVLRWNSVVPASIPHVSTEDDIHNGYFIPKGTLVFANVDSMLRDPRTYKNPDVFNPDRFLGPNPEKDSRDMCFGFGRRICPGLNLADASVFISCAMSCAVFDIGKKIENGRVIEPVYAKMPGTISHPALFDVSIKPRSPKAVALIQSDIRL